MALERAAPFLSDTSLNQARAAMTSDLFQGVVHGLIHLHTQQLPCTNRPSDRPSGNALVAYQAQFGSVVVNAHHGMHRLEPLGIEVLKLANGVRTTDDLLEELMARVARGEIELEENGNPVTAPEAARAMVARRLAKTLASLARSAILVE